MATRDTGTIRRSDNDLARWAVLSPYQVTIDGELFLERLRVIQTPWFAILVTRIFRPDRDRDPHDHSRPFITIPLGGSYRELLLKDPAHKQRTTIRHHRPWIPVFMPRTWAHRITSIEGPLITVVFAGPTTGSFQFWTPDGPVNWQNYHNS